MTLELIALGELLYLASRCRARRRQILTAPLAGRPDPRSVQLLTQKLLAATRGASTLERWVAARLTCACQTVVSTRAFESLVLLAVKRVRQRSRVKGAQK